MLKGHRRIQSLNKDKKKKTHQQNAELPETTAAKTTVRSDLEPRGFTDSDASLGQVLMIRQVSRGRRLTQHGKCQRGSLHTLTYTHALAQNHLKRISTVTAGLLTPPGQTDIIYPAF